MGVGEGHTVSIRGARDMDGSIKNAVDSGGEEGMGEHTNFKKGIYEVWLGKPQMSQVKTVEY